MAELKLGTTFNFYIGGNSYTIAEEQTEQAEKEKNDEISVELESGEEE